MSGSLDSPVRHAGFFDASVTDVDPELAGAMVGELSRQRAHIELIASENLVSQAVLDALGAAVNNKTLEGYPGGRFHGGGEHLDHIENIAMQRACELFGCRHANVQPHSGSQANQAVFAALLAPGDTVMSLALAAGGHLSHGAPANVSGKWFHAVQYGVRRQDGRIDYEQAEALAAEHRPKLVIAGGSSYPRAIDFQRMRAIADSVDALLLVDMAHFAALCVTGMHPHPFPHAHIVTTTTTKTLRGPRGALILCNDADLDRRLRSGVFPGVQGSLHPQVIAAKAVCLGEALRPEFQAYAAAVLANARALADVLMQAGIEVVSGGTDTPQVLMDVGGLALTGDQAEKALERVGITCNKNPVPFDAARPSRWRGVRLGVSAVTTRGFGVTEMEEVAALIAAVLCGKDTEGVVPRVRALCQRFPIYSGRAY
jgi:glycine hydroxymethyltransferase